MEEKIKDHPDLVKVDKAFIVNNNEQQYRAALMRRNTSKKLGSLEERVSSLENGIQQILDILNQNRI